MAHTFGASVSLLMFIVCQGLIVWPRGGWLRIQKPHARSTDALHWWYVLPAVIVDCRRVRIHRMPFVCAVDLHGSVDKSDIVRCVLNVQQFGWPKAHITACCWTNDKAHDRTLFRSANRYLSHSIINAIYLLTWVSVTIEWAVFFGRGFWEIDWK